MTIPIHAFFLVPVLFKTSISKKDLYVHINYDSNVAPRYEMFLFQMYLSQVPRVKQSSRYRLVMLRYMGKKPRGLKVVSLHISNLNYVSVRSWETRTWPAPLTLLCHDRVNVLDQKRSRVESQLPVEEPFVKMIFWSQTECCVRTSIDRDYLRVLQLHFTVSDAIERRTL